MRIYPNGIAYAALLFSFIGLSACSSAAPEKPAMAGPMSQSSAAQERSGGQKSNALASDNLSRREDRSSLDALRRGDAPTSGRDGAMKEIYFDFDRYDLDSEDRAILRANADWLKKNSAAVINIEGHTDEQGSSEYNLALGAKRAQAAKDYLVSLGVAPRRISTISFGEEIPVCRDHQEKCWQQNRRDRFVVSKSNPGA